MRPRSPAVAPERREGEVVWHSGLHRLVVDQRGGRVTSYALGGAELLYRDEDFTRSGSTLWTAPQSAWPSSWPPPHIIDQGRAEVELRPDEARFVLPPCFDLGVAMEKRVALLEDGSAYFEHRLTALRSPVAWALWEVTRLPPGLCWFEASQAPIEGDLGPARALGVTTDHGFHWVPWDGSEGQWCLHARGGTFAAYAAPKTGLLFTQSFDPALKLAPGQGNLKIWREGQRYLELEHTSSYHHLEPRQSFAHRVLWSLRQLPPAAEVAIGSPHLTRASRPFHRSPRTA